MERYLYDELIRYAATDAYPFHMPGHKRRLGGMEDPFRYDITEIEGFDDLHHPRGIILEAQERAARLYHTLKSFFLVGGSTSGILTAISAAAVAAPGKKILLARNCHRSAYHALYLNDLTPVYIYPETYVFAPSHVTGAGDACAGLVGGRISSAKVASILEKDPEIAAVFLTSPTYDGVVSDIAGIAAAAHAHGALLIVDEAHGAHFGFHPDFPPSAVTEGADIVIQSLHKTLPSLTQTALLHVCSDRVNTSVIERFLRIYQSSSPSYVLMASVDQCIRLMRERGRDYLEDLLEMLKRFEASVSRLRILAVMTADDPSRLLIAARDRRLSGAQICDILMTRYSIECEMAAVGYALCLCSIGDDEEGLVRLSEALQEIDMELFLQEQFPEREGFLRAFLQGRDGEEATMLNAEGVNDSQTDFSEGLPEPEIVMPIRKAWNCQAQNLPLEESSGHVSADFVYLYPPGIPLLVPGERISTQIASYLTSCRSNGYPLEGMEDPEGILIRTVRDV